MKPPELEDKPAAEITKKLAPLNGAWYWVPQPSEGSHSWTILTCHDAGMSEEEGHTELWPWVLVQMAAAWGRDAVSLKRQLGLYYTGLPRGRVSRPEKISFILHGNDAPVEPWRDILVERFQLSGRKTKVIFDEDETQIPGHPAAFIGVFEKLTPPTDR